VVATLVKPAEFRTCACGDRWVPLAGELGDTCPPCRLPAPKAKLTRLVDGRLPGEPEAAKTAQQPSLEEA
jgi:hypothetical protein